MSASAIFGSPIVVVPKPSLTLARPTSMGTCQGDVGLLIECSSRPQKKATKHHMKTRPKKTQPWDIRRKPTAYPPLPKLPPEWSLVSSADDVDATNASDSPSSPARQAPVTS
ncbi:hypothetical protein K2173_007981 [Erythroxylum novogranatense]|uniref:50S ribosomal protein 6, chloroplastic n=1 Tax=Erythroxylum novogranatense TaxID=1862640 RepID=A0AAV8T772_9ROSI|nr:hypothetical protein K2173_007981 [Erythroxylum novogranatense]